MNSDSFAAARPDLERLVARRSQQHQCSIAWGVVADGELVLTGACAADPDPLPTDKTVFRIASMTKSFTAAAVMILRDQGLLGLDDVVAEIVPEFAAIAGPTTDSPRLTVRDLLSMAGGMTTDDAWADRHIDASDDEFDAVVRSGATFASAPQTHYEYSNLGYALLGRVIHRVSGRRAQDFITDHLLRPLALHRTTWVQPDHDDWARPYEVLDGRRVADAVPLGDGAMAPMSGLWSCVTDVARWVAWLADAFPPRDGDDSTPLCRASRREMQQVHRAWPTEYTPASGDGDDAVPERVDGGGYGFGLRITHDIRFGHFVAHSGGLPGYGSHMIWLPWRGVGVIALANVTYAPMRVLARRMLETVDELGLIATVPQQASAALLDSAHRLAVLLSDWTDDAANDVFADNVALDEAFARRARRAAEMVAGHGSLVLIGVVAETSTSGRATLRHADGVEVNIDLDLSPLVPPRVQYYEVVAE